ncbi:antibiotic biosynthesis monooxygenase family protein [Pseudoxanthomonas wuyuanensis]
MFAAIWEYSIRPEAADAFEALYGPDGEWAMLFREHPGYRGTELLRSEIPGRYLTIDRWDSEAAYDAFLVAEKPRYSELDARGDALTLEERCVGRYAPPC